MNGADNGNTGTTSPSNITRNPNEETRAMSLCIIRVPPQSVKRKPFLSTFFSLFTDRDLSSEISNYNKSLHELTPVEALFAKLCGGRVLILLYIL